MTDGGEAVVAAFADLGADWIFSSPGSEWAPVWEALARRHRDGIPSPGYLDLLHETVAVGMATGYGLVTRRGQGVLLHALPGLLQGSMAVHGALLAGVPMVVASSESVTYGDGPGPDPGGQWYRNLSVVGGPQAVAARFTKWASQSGSSATLYSMVTRAGEIAGQSPAGPVYLNIPLEVLLEPWNRPAITPVARPGHTVSSPEDIAAVGALLAAAERPVIVTETAGREPGGMAALVALAEAYEVPVVEPSSAVCANFPREHRLHAGSDIEPFMQEADLIVLVNCRAPFYPPSRRPAAAHVVVIDEVPQRPHLVYQVLYATHYLEGAPAATLRALAETPGGSDTGQPAVATARRDRAATLRDAEVGALAAAEHTARADDRVDPVALVAALRDLLADQNAVVVDETITHSRLVQRHLQRREPDSYFYVQGGLGQGIAVALGAKLAVGERPVVLTVGDGAFLYNPVVASLTASRTHDLPLLIIVFNNRQYRSMKMNHLRFYPQGAAVETGEFLGVDLSAQPELSSLAAPFDMHSEAVSAFAELAPALDRALKAVLGGVTALVNVTVTR